MGMFAVLGALIGLVMAGIQTYKTWGASISAPLTISSLVAVFLIPLGAYAVLVGSIVIYMKAIDVNMARLAMTDDNEAGLAVRPQSPPWAWAVWVAAAGVVVLGIGITVVMAMASSY